MLTLKKHFLSAAHLFFPHLCIGCGSDVLRANVALCFNCIDELPHTNFETQPNNPIEKIFIGRLPVIAAHSGFYFSKGQLMQTLVHQFKYKANKNLGLYLSEIMGDKMKSCGRFNEIDYLIPLPLFANKEFKRGFNQAEIICDGLGKAMNIPVLTKNIVRVVSTETQTKKHRTERWDNVAEVFKSTNPSILQNKHIMLVDDVITTGATLEACGQIIHKIPGAKISIAALTSATK